MAAKSVEMLSNAIAEMRTYGEGFVIVDQSPGLMDMSVIRNTNTKIIMRLPDQGDRELVGRAAGLSEPQIQELAKLQSRVVAVYQNDWIEPVLCRIDDREEQSDDKQLPDDNSSKENSSGTCGSDDVPDTAETIDQGRSDTVMLE